MAGLSNSGDNSFLIQCPKCARQLRVPAQVAGKRIKCPNCSQAVKVPGVVAETGADNDWLRLDLDTTQPPAQPSAVDSHTRPPARAANPSAGKPLSTKPSGKKTSATGPATGGQSTAGEPSPPRQLSSVEPKAAMDAIKRGGPSAPASGDGESPSAGAVSSKPSRSLFDDDLPELAALEASQPRSDMSSLLGFEGLSEAASPIPAVPPVIPQALPPQPTGKSKAAKAPGAAQYRIACPICGTPQYVELAQQGRTVKCPDCYSKYPIPAPPANWKPTNSTGPYSFSTELQQPSQAEVARNETRARETADEYLRQAQVELNDDEIESLYQGDFDTQNFVQRTFGFCFDNMALAQLAVFSMFFAIIATIFQWANQNALAGDKGYFLISALAMPICQLIAACPLFAAAMALLESLANDNPKVSHWPGANFFEQIGELLVFAAALLLAVLPGVLLGLLIGMGGAMNWFVLIGGMASALLLFPVILLAMLDNGTLFNPVSMNVLRSITLGTESWGAYYIKTGVAFFGVFLVLAICNSGPALLAGIGWATLPWLVFFTSQQLGVLASDINQHLSLQFNEDQDQAEDD